MMKKKEKRTLNGKNVERLDWMECIVRIEEMRIEKNAPVDVMGCDMLADDNLSPKVRRFQVLVSLMLSSQTKDGVTAAAMQRLKNNGCTIENIIMLSEDELQKLLIPVGFYKRKTEYLKKTADILLKKYNGDIPNTVDELCSLPGVGPKMAYLAMQCAWNVDAGIGVDTHVHRISNRLGLVKTKDPENTRKGLEQLIPSQQWRKVNKLLVGFGQQICVPISPKCSQCLLNDICPAVGVKKAR